MGSISIPVPDPGESTQSADFEEFQKQASLMTSCTLLWKELSDHFVSLEESLMKKSDVIKSKIQTLETETNASLEALEHRESSIEKSVSVAMQKVEDALRAATDAVGNGDMKNVNEEDDEDEMKRLCVKLDCVGFWGFICGKKKEMEVMRVRVPKALSECVDPEMFVLDTISEVFPVDKREAMENDLGWACVLMLESLVPLMVDPLLGDSRVFVTPRVKQRANQIAEKWKQGLEARGGAHNLKGSDVHTFLQHLVTFGIAKEEDFGFYRNLVVASAWRKQMPKLAVSLGLAHQMPEMIEELISRGQQVDAVHFTQEVGLVERFPPVPLLKAFLKDAKKAATSIMEDPNNSGRATHLAARKEQSALKVVIKCIEEYKLESEFPPENLKKRLEQLEKVKIEKKRPAAASPANKRTRACNVGPMPPTKAGRITNTYVSSFPAPPPTFVRSPPSHTQYPSPPYTVSPQMYGHGNSRTPPTNHYVTYSPEAAPHSPGFSYPSTPPMNYPHPPPAVAYVGYGGYQQAYYR